MARRIQKGRTRGRRDIGRFAFRAGSTNKRPLGLLSAPAKHSSCQNFTKILRLTENRETKKERKTSGILRRGATGFSARFWWENAWFRSFVKKSLHAPVRFVRASQREFCALYPRCVRINFSDVSSGSWKYTSGKKERKKERVKKKKKLREVETIDG